MAFVSPAALIDEREARYLPRLSAYEVFEGDEAPSSTVTRPGLSRQLAGAVDSLMLHLYAAQPRAAPSKCRIRREGRHRRISRLNIFEDMKDELIALSIKGWSIATETRPRWPKATNYAAQMLQSLRKAMGDVHGSKPALRRSAYDAIKWASTIRALFEGRQVGE